MEESCNSRKHQYQGVPASTRSEYRKTIRQIQRHASFKFEKGVVANLRIERIEAQKRTFTKWMNSHLNAMKIEVTDLFKDLSDGYVLSALIEILSNDNAPLRLNRNASLRIQKLDNVNECLRCLRNRYGVDVETISAENVVDGDPARILGLIWRIILRFHVSAIHNIVNGSSPTKLTLLEWAQTKTQPYANVNITNFTTSWSDGLAFNALLHSQCKRLIQYERLQPENAIDNLNNAFDVALKHYGIKKLLEADDVVHITDERCIITYVASYYLHLR